MVATVLVVGSQRSGTTLLNRILNGHPAIGMLFQQSNFLRLDPRDYDLSKPEERVRLIGDGRKKCSVYSALFDDRVERELLSQFTGRGSFGEIYEALLRAIVPKKPSQLCGEKYAGRCVEAQKFFDTTAGRIVHIVRDPRDVCASEKQRLVKLGGAAGDYLITLDDWREGVAIGDRIQQAEPSRYLRVRYEDLVAQPERELRLLCRFLGLAFDSRMTDAASFTEDDGAPWAANSFFDDDVREVRRFGPRWPNVLTGSEVRFIERFCRKGMDACGYEPASKNAWMPVFGFQSFRRKVEAAVRPYLEDPVRKPYTRQ
jgi:hypothetical protein